LVEISGLMCFYEEGVGVSVDGKPAAATGDCLQLTAPP
jgi:hypothetical protein